MSCDHSSATWLGRKDKEVQPFWPDPFSRVHAWWGLGMRLGTNVHVDNIQGQPRGQWHVIIRSWCLYLDDVLQSEKGNFRKFSTPTLKVGINCLSPRRVLKMMSHLQQINQSHNMCVHTYQIRVCNQWAPESWWCELYTYLPHTLVIHESGKHTRDTRECRNFLAQHTS